MFDYLAVLISIILGLGLTHLLLGCSRMIQLRHTVRPYWVQLVWTLSILIYMLAVWWGMFWWKHLIDWTVQEFFFLSAYAIVLFMLASILFPLDHGEGLDFEDYFFRNKNWFFGLLIVALLFDVPETIAKSVSGLRSVPPQYLLFMPCALALSVAGLMSRSRRLHGVISVIWLAALLSYMIFTSLDRIVAS